MRIFLSFDAVLATVANRELMYDYYMLDEIVTHLRAILTQVPSRIESAKSSSNEFTENRRQQET